MSRIANDPTPKAWALRWGMAGLGVLLLAFAVIKLRDGGPVSEPHAGQAGADPAPGSQTAEDRCADALTLVTAEVRWPVLCRWRLPADGLEGQAYPPPPGPPPFDQPRVEIYVGPAQDRVSLAHAIAHELGHMHHTRDPRFVPEWLLARALPPDTKDELWTEDYAEVFAALFAPTVERWRAPTPRPDAPALAALKVRFFADA